MLCDHCHKHQATATVQQTVNGTTTVLHLCAACAEEYQRSGLFGAFFDPSLFFSGFFSSKQPVRDTKTCPQCGATLSEIRANGHLGCSQCVKTFQEELLPIIRKIHGNAVHTGKVPKNAPPEIKSRRQLELLEKQLQEAVSKQEFEYAAELRDEINRLKGSR